MRNIRLFSLLSEELLSSPTGFVYLILNYDYNIPDSRPVLGVSTNGSTITRTLAPDERFAISWADLIEVFSLLQVGLADMPVKWERTAFEWAHGYKISRNWKVNCNWSVWTSWPVSTSAVVRHENDQLLKRFEAMLGRPAREGEFEDFMEGATF